MAATDAAGVEVAPAAEQTVAPAAVRSLAACAQAWWQRCPLKERVEARVRARTRLVIGTACSGTDSCIKSLEHLGSVTGWSFHHAFSCEETPGKQAWIRDNFPGLPQLFPDVKKLHTGECLNVITGVYEPLPDGARTRGPARDMVI